MPVIDREAFLAAKCERERKRRQAFTPEQRAAAHELSRLYSMHRRHTDAQYLSRVRETVRRSHAKTRQRINEQKRAKYRLDREKVIAHYGGRCACCAEAQFEFLAVDHVVDRYTDRKNRVGGDREGQPLILWIIKHNFPEGFQILCHNCNTAKSFYGVCPHTAARQVA